MQVKLFRAGILLCLAAASAFAQSAMTVSQVKDFVHTAIQDIRAKRATDAEVAKLLMTFKMKQKLEAGTVEDLQSEGAGPKTVLALKHLMEISASLTPPAPPAVAPPKPTYADTHPPPPYEEQYAILNEAREMAINYTKSLPNFVCLQTTRRYTDRHFKAGQDPLWSLGDTLKAKVGYFNGKEDYQLLGINDDSVVNKNYNSVGGSISTGEFGSMLKEIFDPNTHTEFHWLRWGTLNGKRYHVYQYKVEQENSRWSVDYQHTDQVTPAYTGLAYLDVQSHLVMRITLDALMPPNFPIQDVHSLLDYGYADIAGQPALVPVRSEVKMRHDLVATKNEIDFRGYRKYSADTTIRFDDVDDTPAETAKEKPAAPVTKKP